MVQFALILWFPVTMVLFLVVRPHIAAAVSYIFGLMLLPSLRSIPVPVIGDLDQSTIPSLVSFVMAILIAPKAMLNPRPGSGPEILIVLLAISSLLTNLTNTDPQVFGANVLPGMTMVDSINDTVMFTIRWGLPFYLGRALVRTPKQATEVLRVLAIGGLLYIPPILVELQTGPLFHRLVYGAYPSASTFYQNIKFGGFRPVVLMNHGLTVSAFMLFATIAWFTLSRAGIRIFGISMLPLAIVSVSILALCKSVAVYVYAICVLPVLMLARPRLQLIGASIVAALILGYPLLRLMDLVPIEAVEQIAIEYSGEGSAHSFMARISTEEDILERARDRIVFGWGGYARYWIWDPTTGESRTIIDGLWLAKLGEGGVVRFLLIFGLLLYPVFYALWRLPRIRDKSVRYLICGFAWIVVIRTFDLLPNSGAEAYLTFFSGATYAVARHAAKSERPEPRDRSRRASSGDRPPDPGQGPEPQQAEVPGAVAGLLRGNHRT